MNLLKFRDIVSLSWKPPIFNQWWTFQFKYVQGPHALTDLFLVSIEWEVFKTLGHVTLKAYGTESQIYGKKVLLSFHNSI
jgi:hypothetical protein